MRKTAFFLLATGAGALLTACAPGVETDFIPPDKLVAVSSLLSPQDSLLTVLLYRGQLIGGKMTPVESTVETGAVVELSDGIRTVRLAYQPARFRYERPAADLPIRAGNTYFLTVKTTEGIALKSQCRVPSAVSDLRIDGSQQTDDYEFEASWMAPPGNAFALVTGSTPTVSTGGQNFYGNVRFDQAGGADFIGSWLTDEQRSGKNLLTGRVQGTARMQSVSLKIEVFNLEGSLHRYRIDARDLTNFNINTDGFIPTFREPRPVYTNVEGGVGIFAAYNPSEVVLKIK